MTKTKKSSQLKFENGGREYIADFQHLRVLFDSERGNLLKMSGLDEISVYLKPIERQRSASCLKVFSDKVIVALEQHANGRTMDVSGTVLFIRKVLNWWTILNVKSRFMDLRKKQSPQAVMSDSDDPRLYYILEFGEMCLKMAGKQGKKDKKL